MRTRNVAVAGLDENRVIPNWYCFVNKRGRRIIDFDSVDSVLPVRTPRDPPDRNATVGSWSGRSRSTNSGRPGRMVDDRFWGTLAPNSRRSKFRSVGPLLQTSSHRRSPQTYRSELAGLGDCRRTFDPRLTA